MYVHVYACMCIRVCVCVCVYAMQANRDEFQDMLLKYIYTSLNDLSHDNLLVKFERSNNLCDLRANNKLYSLQWHNNGRDRVSNHQPHDCLLNRLFRSKKTSKLSVTVLYAGNSPGTGGFPAQMASNAENVSIWWRHHVSRLTNRSTMV